MTWPLWNKGSEEDVNIQHHSNGSQTTGKKSSVLDTVDSFKLEPSNKMRHVGIRASAFNFRQSHFNIAGPQRLKRHTSTTETFFEPSSITEYKRLRYITNRELNLRRSTAYYTTGVKSGSYDKHCVFVSITGITIKLSLGQRRPVEPGSLPRITWVGSRYGSRIPRYASNASHFSMRLSETLPLSGHYKRTMNNNVALYMSTDKDVEKTPEDKIYDAKKLRQSLELQAKDLYTRFSTSSSTENLNLGGPKLSFVWDEMGLSLQPLSTTRTSLYEVLTKDQVQIKKGAQKAAKKTHDTPKRKGHTGIFSNNEKRKHKKSKKSQDMERFSFSGTDHSIHLDDSCLREPTKNKKPKAKKSHSLSADEHHEDFPVKKSFKNKQQNIKQNDEVFPAKKTFLQIPKRNKPSYLSPSLRKEQKGGSTEDSSVQDFTQNTREKKTPYSAFDKIMDSNIPVYSYKMSQEKATLSSRPFEMTTGDYQPLLASSMPEEVSDSKALSQNGSSETMESVESYLKTLYSKEGFHVEPNVLLEKPIISSRTSFDYKSPISSSTSSDFKSPVSPGTPSNYNSIIASRTPSDYKSMIPTPTTSESTAGLLIGYRLDVQSSIPLNQLEKSSDIQLGTPYKSLTPSYTSSENPTPLGEETLTEESETPQTPNFFNGFDREDKFYDCISLEDSRDMSRNQRNFVRRLSALLGRAKGWLFSQIFGKRDKYTDADNKEDDSETNYFSPRTVSEPELYDVSNSNSSRMLYYELWRAQLELKELWVENANLRAKLGQDNAVTANGGSLMCPTKGKET
ncbi:hypothetical protein ElyMa_005564100 [Elysia marginata]|uniref:Uncharacterized protein n=1 Tax=Elysia marginata TaxID=1093978 RepID=A0AAV4F0S5_9GAST|nr:hypothetical protein ElyMa_005564100 [Elysia marginata]